MILRKSGLEVQRGLGQDLAGELGLEVGEAFPSGEGVAVDVEEVGDDGGGLVFAEEADGAELVG